VRYLIVACAVVAAIAILTPPIRAYNDLRIAENDAERSYKIAEATNSANKAELENLSNPSYIKAQARSRFGYVEPGETLIRVSTPLNALPADGSEAESQTAAENPSSANPQDPNAAALNQKLKPWYEQLRDSIVALDEAETP
jgi:hypothetical protein